MKYLISPLIALLLAAPVYGQIAILGDIIHTVSQGSINQGIILISSDGKIERVGSVAEIGIPGHYTIHRAAVVTPGLIDGRSTVGLSGILNVRGDQDQLETSEPVQPELRAFDAFDANEELVLYLRANGITTVHTGHAPGAPVSGQTMVVKTTGGKLSDVLLIPAKMLVFTLGGGVSGSFKSPGTRAKTVALLRAELSKAQAYKAKLDRGEDVEPNLRMQALVSLLNGEYKALVYANKAVDIQSAFRLADEFGFELVLDGAAEVYLFTEQLKSSGASLILHPTMARANGDLKNMSMATAAVLAEAGIPFSLQSGFEPYVPKTRVVRFEAAMAAAYGLPFDEALRSVTLTPAQILGLDNRIGSIEAGKDADLVLYDGDPFEYLTKVCKVFIEGELVEDRCGL